MKGARRIHALAGAILPALAVPTWSAAADERVEITTAFCPAESEEAIRRVARVEIGNLLFDENLPPPAALDRIIVACRDDLVSLQLSPRSGQARVGRQVRLHDFPADSQPRVIALAALELLATVSPAVQRRIELRETASPEAPPAPTPLRVLAFGVQRSFFASGGLATWGAGIKTEVDLWQRFGISVDVEGGGDRGSVEFGRVTSYVGSAGALLDVRRGFGDFVARGGLGGRLGIARLRGEPTPDPDVSGRTLVRPWGGPVANAQLQWGRRWFSLALGLEAGFAALGARGIAQQSTAAAASGAWLAFFLAAGAQR